MASRFSCTSIYLLLTNEKYKFKCLSQILPSDSERSSSEAQSICRFSMSSRGNNPSASKDAGGNPLSLLPPTVGFLIRIGFDDILFSLP
jgi:hypothetical protein